MPRQYQFKKGDRALYIRFHHRVGRITMPVRILKWNQRTNRWVIGSDRGGRLEAAECELEQGTVLDHMVWETKQ